MKRGQHFVALLLSVFLLMVTGFAAVAAAMPVIDGDPENKEWDDSRKALLFTSTAQSGNNVSFGYFYCIPDFEKDRFAFAFRGTGEDCGPGSLAGVRLKVEGFGALQFDFTAPDNPTYGGELLHVRSAMKSWGNVGMGEDFTAEAIVDLKRAFPAILTLTVQILDRAGEPSRPFSFIVENESAIVATSPPVLSSAHPPVSTSKAPKTSTTKAAKPKSADTSSATRRGVTVPPPSTPPQNAGTLSETIPTAVPHSTYTIPPTPPNSLSGGSPQSGTGGFTDTETVSSAPTDGNTLPVEETNDSSGNSILRTAAFAAAFALLIAAAAVGILRKPEGEAPDKDG
ncbi:MAG: hypothetical protein LBT21_04465 [Oscillospiraceae bacterium]|jgi:hypothetical protein|nr:hypothetical protein [Oscillospiraceae bacterium]